MPAAIPFAVAAFQTAAAVATTVGTAMGFSGVIATVAGAAAIAQSTVQAWNAVSSAIGSKPKVNSAQTQLQTKVGAVTPRAVIMGRTAVAGTLLTPTPLQSGRGNALATNFYALSHAGPSGVVESVQWGDDTVTFDAQGQAIGKYANNMWLFQKNGSWSQTSITFTGTPGIGADTPTAWDSTKRAQGCLVVALVVRYAASVLANNMQTPLFVVDANAAALTDPRTGSAATTQAQRRNPAVWAYSWRLGWFQNSKRVIGLGQTAAELHAAGYAYAANVADANGWTISGEASTADDRYAVEMAILQACASVPVERNGLQSVVTSATRSSVGTITSNDLRADPKWRYNTQQSSRPTAIQTRYRSETNRWQMVEGAEVTDASWLTQDAGREKRVMVEYAYAGGGSAHVGHLAALDASNAREPLVFTLQCKQQARYAGFVGDAVTVSLPEIGLSSTKMVVVSRIVNPDGTVDYELLVETDAKYAFAAGKTSAAPSFTLQPGFDIFSVPQPDLADWSAAAVQITSGATSLPIVRVTGSASNYNFASGVVFKLRLNSGGSPWLVSEDAPPAATQHEFRGLTSATSYIVGIAYRGVTGVEGPVRELAAVTTGTLVAGEAGAGIGGAPILNSEVGIGSNAIADNDFSRLTDTSVWTLVNVPSFSTSHARQVGTNGFAQYLAQVSGTPPSGQQFGRYGSGDNRLSVSAGERVQASALVGGFGLTSALIQIFWWNASGSIFLSNGKTVTGIPTGGLNPSNYVRDGLSVDVPAGAVAASFNVYGNTAGAVLNPYLYSAQEMLCKVPAGQTALAPYAPGFRGQPGADVTGGNTAAGFAGQGNQSTINRFRQSTAPSSPQEGDIWEDTSTTPVSYRKRMSGAWVFQSEEGADITAQAVPSVEGPTSISFDVDAVGALSPGSQVPRTLQFIRKRGNTDVSNSTTWSIVSPVNITLGAITNGGVNVTAVAAGLSNFTVRSVRDGVTIDHLVNVQKNTIAAGVISATRKQVTSTAGTPNNGNWTDVASMVISATPTGNLFFNSSFASIVAGTGTCSHEARLTVDGVQVGAIQAAQATVTGGVPEAVDFEQTFAQVIPVTAGSRTIAFQLRRTTGAGQITTSAITFDVAAFPG